MSCSRTMQRLSFNEPTRSHRRTGAPLYRTPRGYLERAAKTPRSSFTLLSTVAASQWQMKLAINAT
jgi:hypothetical protein